MRFLGLDQSYTSTGWALKDTSNDSLTVGLIRTVATDGDIFDRCHITTTKISALVELYAPDIIAIEGLAFGQFGNATRDLAGLQFSVIIDIRHRMGYTGDKIRIITPNSLKKHATDSGKAKKVDMWEAVPYNIKQQILSQGYKKTKGLYDIVDAYWLADYISH